MIYWFIVDNNGTRHIVAARSLTEAINVAASAGLIISSIYMLHEATFSDAGFLMTAN